MRCFVALWPDDEVRRQLDAVIDKVAPRWPGARRMRAENLHLTLAFIGELPSPRAHELAGRLAHLDTHEFPDGTWVLNQLGVFARARVLWAGGAPSQALDRYAGATRELLTRMSIPFDSKPFAAHVTLLRDLPAREQAPATGFSISWPLTPPRVVESVPSERGGRYLCIA
jgi:2'-5' RNA ligase